MNKLKTFAAVLTKSLSEPAYYNHVVKAKFSFSLKYFLFFHLILSLLITIQFNFRTKPQIQTLANDTIHQITTNYPQPLILTLENNQLSVEGVEEPLNVAFPDFLDSLNHQGDYDYFATIDTTQDLPKNKSFLTFTKSDLIFRRPDGRKETVPFSDINETIVVDKNTVGLTTSAIQTTLNTIIAYSPFIILAGSLTFLPLIALSTLLIFSLFTWLVSNILKKNLTYKKSFQIGLHTITFAQTVNFLQNFLFPNLNFDSLFSLAFFGATLLALNPLKPLPTNKTPLS